MKPHLPLFAAAAFAAFLAIGCASSNYQKARTTSTSLRDAAESVDRALVPLDKVVRVLSDMINDPAEDLRSQFRTFKSVRSDLEAQSTILREHAAMMQEMGSTYLQVWSEELAMIENDAIQSRSQARQKAVAERFANVRSDYLRTTADFAPFLSNLRDIETALATDLTAGGLDSIKNLEKQVTADAIPLRASLVELSVAFKSLGVSLSPSTPAAGGD